MNKGLSLEEIIEKLFGEFNIEILEKKDVKFKCNCNRERIEGVLISLGYEELNSIIEEDGQAEIVCHFCNTKYNFSKKRIIRDSQ